MMIYGSPRSVVLIRSIKYEGRRREWRENGLGWRVEAIHIIYEEHIASNIYEEHIASNDYI